MVRACTGHPGRQEREETVDAPPSLPNVALRAGPLFTAAEGGEGRKTPRPFIKSAADLLSGTFESNITVLVKNKYQEKLNQGCIFFLFDSDIRCIAKVE